MTTPSVPASGLPVAVDAMGGDKAPGEIVAGALEARDTYGLPVVLVGPRDQMGDVGDLPVIEASEVIAMDEEPGSAVRHKKDSSLVRAAEAVRDGKACATVSAGNTGAAMASALLRMGRLKGIARPGSRRRSPASGTTQVSSSTPAPTPSATPRCSCSSPRWDRHTRQPDTTQRHRPWGCCPSARSRRRARRL